MSETVAMNCSKCKCRVIRLKRFVPPPDRRILCIDCRWAEYIEREVAEGRHIVAPPPKQERVDNV